MEMKIQTVEEILCKDIPGKTTTLYQIYRLVLQVFEICQGPWLWWETRLQAFATWILSFIHGFLCE